MRNKYQYLEDEIKELISRAPSPSSANIAKHLQKQHGLSGSGRHLRRFVDSLKKNSGLNEVLEQQGIDPGAVTNYWYKGKHYSIHAKGDLPDYHSLKDEIVEEMKKHAPKYTKIKREAIIDGHMLVLSPADIHIGKLSRAFETGEEYNSQIAVKRVHEGVHGILNKCSGFNLEKIILIVGNDILHVDNPKRQTTNGTPQDTDGQWFDNFLTAKRLYVDIIETLCGIADVHVIFNRSNHDHMSGFFLADTIHSWFSRHPNITFDIDLKDRKYTTYGVNLIGSTHGDGAKIELLPLLMAQECPVNWGMTKHRYIYTHHVHHKISKDFAGVTVEALRSPSSADGWHSRNGYQHAPKAIEGFIHHPKDGQVARISHFF